MTNISIVSGDQVNLDVNNQVTGGLSVVSQPTSSVSVAGIVSGKGDSHFVYAQPTPESVWEVTHSLNKKPSVTVVDSADTVVIGEVEYLSSNAVRLTFVGAFSGKAYFN